MIVKVRPRRGKDSWETEIENIKELDYIKKWSNFSDFVRFSVSDNHIMAEMRKSWWVIAYVDGCNHNDLLKYFPEWEPTLYDDGGNKVEPQYDQYGRIKRE